MSVRTTEKMVTFQKPFTLMAADKLLPAGSYRVFIDEEEVLGLSFLAYRRTGIMLETPAVSDRGGGPSQFIPVSPVELDALIEAEKQA